MFFSINSSGQREWHDIFKVMKGRNLQPRVLYPARLLFRFNDEVKGFTDKQKQREFSATKLALQKNAKGSSRRGKEKAKMRNKEITYEKAHW